MLKFNFKRLRKWNSESVSLRGSPTGGVILKFCSAKMHRIYRKAPAKIKLISINLQNNFIENLVPHGCSIKFFKTLVIQIQLPTLIGKPLKCSLEIRKMKLIEKNVLRFNIYLQNLRNLI